MNDHWLTEIRIFPFESLPAGWVPCDGQLLPINDHMALFSLIGLAFGGDGRQNFAVPDLRGKVPVGGPGRGKNAPSPSNAAGPKETQPTVALVYAICVDGRTTFAVPNLEGAFALHPGKPEERGQASGVSAEDGSTRPLLVLQYCLAMKGIFPPRSS